MLDAYAPELISRKSPTLVFRVDRCHPLSLTHTHIHTHTLTHTFRRGAPPPPATDALRGGALVVTLPNTNWPSRVATSLLRNVGLPWLVTHSKMEFENVAVRLATTPVLHRAAQTRLLAPLDALNPTEHFGPEFASCAIALEKSRRAKFYGRRDEPASSGEGDAGNRGDAGNGGSGDSGDGGDGSMIHGTDLWARCAHVDRSMRNPLEPSQELGAGILAPGTGGKDGRGGREGGEGAAGRVERRVAWRAARRAARPQLALFDIMGYTKNYWRALRAMWEIYAVGNPPMHVIQP